MFEAVAVARACAFRRRCALGLGVVLEVFLLARGDDFAEALKDFWTAGDDGGECIFPELEGGAVGRGAHGGAAAFARQQ